MTDRSNIDLLGNSTTGINLGVGDCIFKCKNVTGNTLEFKTILVTGGSLSIITGDTTITINSTGGGSITGTTNYIPRFDSIGNNFINSSIFDSGTTNCDNVRIFRYNLLLGDNVANGCKIIIKPSFTRKIELIAPSGVNIGDLNACVCIGCTTDGLTLCAATYQDLLLHAGTAVSAGCAGKTLRLSGGDGIGAAGGNVVLTGGTGTVGGNILLSTSNSGKVIISNLLAKTTETCAVYINASGCLSKGIVGTGNTTISGIATRIPVFNATSNNISATTMSFVSNTLCNSNNMIIDVPDTKDIYLNATHIAGNYGCITLGKPTTSASVTSQRISIAGAATNIDMMLTPKNAGQIYALAATVNLSNSGQAGFAFTSASRTLQLPTNTKICGYGGSAGTSNCDATPICIVGGFGTNYNGGVGNCWAGSGGTILICGGCACDGGVGVQKIGGSVILKAGAGINGGAAGRIQLCGLPVKTSESCVVYIDSTGKLSTGVSSGGTGGLSVAVTGATNGLNVNSANRVGLGGTLTGLTLICGGLGTGLAICSICGSCCATSSICCGGNFSSSINNATTWCGNISNSGFIQINSANAASVCKNEITIRPDAVYFTVTGPAGNTGFQYAADYCVKMNANCRVIPDVDWIKRYTIGGWSNLARGTTVMGCGTVVSGGTICCDTFFGAGAGAAITTGRQNVGIGTLALQSITSGCFNTAVGAPALPSTSTGCYNTGVGWGALNGNTGGHFNTAFGMNASSSNGTGSCNTALGYAALYANSGGNDNVAVGNCALASNTVTGNVAIGACALLLNNSGVGNLAVGQCALLVNSSGSNNLAIGHCALRTTTVGSNNIAIGKEALFNNIASENIAIGLNALRANTTGIGNTAIGVNTLQANTIGFQNVAIGCFAMYNNTGGTYNIGVGYQALLTNKGGSNNFAFGANALYQNTNGSNSIAIGGGTLQSNTLGNTNIGIGNSALQNNTVGACNIAIGSGALAGAVGHCGTNNIVLGRLTMQVNTTGSNNVAIGLGSLNQNTTGGVNTALGEQTLYCNTTGSGNVSVGCGAGYRNTTGTNSVYIGLGAGYCNTGTEVTAVGTQAGYGSTGFAASRGVFLGRCAGFNETTADKLHIANCATCTLICGDFAACTVKICGSVEASGAIKPASSTDAGMPINSIYFSTNSSKLVYKDSGSVVHDLY